MAPKDGADRGSRGSRGDRGGRRGRGADRSRRPGDRGGIDKQRGKAPPVDQDGDQDMDGGGRGDRSRGRGKSGSRGGRESRGADRTRSDRIQRGLAAGQGNILDFSASIRILGLKDCKAAKTQSDGGVRLLKEFIERKASNLHPKTAVKVKQSHSDGDWIIFNTSPEDAAKITVLNGYSFAGQKLEIQAVQPGVEYEAPKKELSEEAKETFKNIRSVLEERYVVDDKLLNLSALGQDEKLVNMGFFEDTHTVGKLFPVMMVVCNDIFTDDQKKVEYVPSISLARNAITNVSMVNDLADSFPSLQNLDLEFNQIQDLRGLDTWRHKFRNLERLRLNGNPITNIPSDYKERLMEWFPRLHVLNDVQIRSDGEVALAMERARLAEDVTPIPVADWDFRDIADVALNFLPLFIAGYDSADRSALADSFYDDQSVLSISVNNRAPRRGEQQKEAVAPWDAYLQKSRNLAKITHLPARMSRTHVGVADIKLFWSTLPPTKHPDFQTAKDKWIVDCHALPGLPDITGQNPHGVDGLIISMHGEFTESDPTDTTIRNLRSFSRTLVLGPGTGPGGIRVISDMMTYRAHNAILRVGPPPTAEQELVKTELIQRLSTQTSMTPESARVCLEQAEWDWNAALTYFNDHKHEIPAEGWVNGKIPTY